MDNREYFFFYSSFQRIRESLVICSLVFSFCSKEKLPVYAYYVNSVGEKNAAHGKYLAYPALAEEPPVLLYKRVQLVLGRIQVISLYIYI